MCEATPSGGLFKDVETKKSVCAWVDVPRATKMLRYFFLFTFGLDESFSFLRSLHVVAVFQSAPSFCFKFFVMEKKG